MGTIILIFLIAILGLIMIAMACNGTFADRASAAST